MVPIEKEEKIKRESGMEGVNGVSVANGNWRIGNYVDDVLYDMVPMEAGHVLLRRPWQYDRDIVHNGVTNRYSFLHKGKKVVLSPLSPSEVCEDQIKMRLKIERENKIKEGKSSLREKRQKQGNEGQATKISVSLSQPTLKK